MTTMEPEPQTEDEWNWEDDNAGNQKKWHENKTATRKLTGEKRRHKKWGRNHWKTRKNWREY
eukprot:13451828-Ditylum_brightwellii.AAC.1